MSFGELLEQKRTERGMSQNELAAVSGVSVGNINQIERGKRGVPTLQTLYALADGLGVPRAQRLAFFEQGFANRILDDVQKLAIYEYLLLIGEAEADAVLAPVRAELAENAVVHDVLARHGLTAESLTAEQLLIMLAEDDHLATLRAQMAWRFVEQVIIDVKGGRVDLLPGLIATDLLASLPPEEADDGESSGAGRAALPPYLQRAARRSRGT